MRRFDACFRRAKNGQCVSACMHIRGTPRLSYRVPENSWVFKSYFDSRMVKCYPYNTILFHCFIDDKQTKGFFIIIDVHT